MPWVGSRSRGDANRAYHLQPSSRVAGAPPPGRPVSLTLSPRRPPCTGVHNYDSCDRIPAMSERISTLEVRRRLGDILNRVHLRHDRFVIERRGTPLAAVVPVETLESLERLSREFMLEVLRRGRGGLAEAEADALADEAKHRSRKRR